MQNSKNTVISKKRSSFMAGAGILAWAFCIFLAACSSDNKPIKVRKVDDAVKINVSGIENKEILENVRNYLLNLPEISLERARLYRREITDKIADAVYAYGYYNPVIDITFPDPSNEEKNTSDIFKEKSIEAAVSLGKPLYIRNCQVQIVGEGAFYAAFENIVKSSRIKMYTVLDHGAYTKLKEDLKAKAFSFGFFDAKLITSRILVYKDQNMADIELIYDTGKRYRVGQIVSSEETSKLIKPSLSLATFKEGDYYLSDKISEYSKALSQTNYYKSVDISSQVDKRKDGMVPVSIELERQSRNLYRIGLGASTDEKFRMIFSWDKPLVNDEGHSFSSYFRMSAVKQDAQAIYKIPRKNPNLDYYYFKLSQSYTDYNDTLSKLSHASIHYVANSTGVWRRDFYLACEYEDFKQGDEVGYPVNVMPGILLSRRSTTGGVDPKAGYSITLDTKFGTRVVGDQNFVRSVLSIKGIFSPTENTRVSYSLTQGAIMGQDASKVPSSMRFFVGGEQSLRGFSYLSESTRFDDGKLKGSKYMTAGSIEYMFPIGIDSARGAVFLDSAVCTDSYSKQKDVLLGPGIGLRYVTDFGTAKIDIGYGINNSRNTRQFKLHFTFGPEF